MTLNKGYGPQFGVTAYISEVNRARKIKSDAQVVTNKISDPMQKYFLWVAGNSAPNSKFRPLLSQLPLVGECCPLVGVPQL